MVLLLFSFAIIIIIEVPGLVRNQMWRELAVFCGFTAIGFAYGIIHLFEIGILNPTDITTTLFKPVFEAFDNLLK